MSKLHANLETARLKEGRLEALQLASQGTTEGRGREQVYAVHAGTPVEGEFE